MLTVQSNLATFIERTDGAKFQNELYRNVDFLVTDTNFAPLIVIEINDKTHESNSRRERDEKVSKICQEAGVPILTFWTEDVADEAFIGDRLKEVLNSLPVGRVHHFDANKKSEPSKKSKSGCYIATSVYGTYSCPELWVLRRFRDEKLLQSTVGSVAVNFYYAVSPSIVRTIGKFKIFNRMTKKLLDSIVDHLRSKGISDNHYNDLH